MPATTRSSGLSVTLPSDREIRLARDFDAPRELVFDTFTKPEHLVHWMTGPEGWTFLVCEVDLRPGGAWRYIQQGPDGTKMGMQGTYDEVVRPERVVGHEVFDDFANVEGEVIPWPSSPAGEATSTMTLREADGRTTYTETLGYRSAEARDAALETGMDQGMAAGFDRLAEYLRTLS